MRTILFRGKRSPDEKWTYGYYAGSNRYITDHTIYDIEFVCMNGWTVLPDTVGQYIGVNDKNGKKIFEGDVIAAIFRSNHSRQTFKVIFENGSFVLDNGCVKVHVNEVLWLEVIGNIHDNPELMEEAK